MKPNVLIIDDSLDLHALIRVRLSKEPVNVLSATDPESGITLARTSAPDLILLDLALPDCHGYRLAERIRQLPSGRQLVLVALTAFALTGDEEHSRAAGIDAHFRKPMDFELLPEIKRLGATTTAGETTPKPR